MKPPINQLSTLSDDEAVQLLHTLASSDIDYPHYVQELTALSKLPLNPKQQADIARNTLMVMAEQDPQQAEAIIMLLNNSAPNRFDGGSTILTLAGVAFFLRTHIRIKLNAEGKWELLIEHKPSKNSLLSDLVDKIKGLIESNGQE